ncbi:uncharacterized protein BKA78DRAFT_85064 [Phyllosticta capitalensis]|uniref:uncharacterized protein n=1 Tax=Phyllosticta capitalensis TaxID=121624 RepID=UPI0031302DDC
MHRHPSQIINPPFPHLPVFHQPLGNPPCVTVPYCSPQALEQPTMRSSTWSRGPSHPTGGIVKGQARAGLLNAPHDYLHAHFRGT